MRHVSTIRLFLMFLVHHVESSGISESSLRQDLHLDDGWLESLGHEEVVEIVPRFMRAAQRLVNDELMCLHAGEHFHFCLAGAGGLAATHAPTPTLALETFSRFVSGDGLVSVKSHVSAERTTMTVNVVAPWRRPIREQVIDGFFSGLIAALRAVCGSSFAPLDVRLSRSSPADPRSFARCMRRKVSFRFPQDEIVLPTPVLTKTSLLYEPLLYEQLRFIADLSAERPSGMGPLRQLVEQAIRSGDHTIERVGETLQVNQRTLQRRLQREGVTFRTVLKEVRVGLAQDLLLESSLSVTEVAERLHYSDDKALRKALKAITGKTPTEIRGERGR